MKEMHTLFLSIATEELKTSDCHIFLFIIGKQLRNDTANLSVCKMSYTQSFERNLVDYFKWSGSQAMQIIKENLKA